MRRQVRSSPVSNIRRIPLIPLQSLRPNPSLAPRGWLAPRRRLNLVHLGWHRLDGARRQTWRPVTWRPVRTRVQIRQGIRPVRRAGLRVRGGVGPRHECPRRVQCRSLHIRSDRIWQGESDMGVRQDAFLPPFLNIVSARMAHPLHCDPLCRRTPSRGRGRARCAA